MKKNILILFCLVVIKITTGQTSKNLNLLGSLNFPGQKLSGCWHYNHSSGKEYALVGALNGIAIVDISDPANPLQLFQLPGNSNQWHEVKVLGDYGYAVSEGSDANGIMNGVQIIDLRYLPDSAPNKFYRGDGVIFDQLITAHSITATGKYVYVNGHNISSLGRGVLILDVSDPMNPVYTGAITARYCHDSYVRGDTIYTSDIQDGMFTIYNIFNRSNPIQLATQITPGQFNHSTWLSNDGNTIFAADERNNTPVGVFDVSDFNNISLIDTFYNANFTDKEVHNVRVINDFLINPSYGSQLTIADAAHPNNLIEIANYTTGSFLCWDADPFCNSGNIIATDMYDQMLYIFSPVYRRACYLEGIVSDSLTGLPINIATIDILVTGVTKNSGNAGEYYTGYADSGTYTVSYSKANYITRQIPVTLQNGVLTTLDVKLLPVGTGIAEEKGNYIQVYPNPVNDNFFIQSIDKEISEWKLMDICGRVVLQNENTFQRSEKLIIDARALKPGIYSLKLLVKGEYISRTIVRL